jgi:hypothetical protein
MFLTASSQLAFSISFAKNLDKKSFLPEKGNVTCEIFCEKIYPFRKVSKTKLDFE